MTPERIHVVLTGGTIDSRWNGLTDTITPLESSAVPEFLTSLSLEPQLTFSEVCMKDSRSLGAADLDAIAAAISGSPIDHVLVTHGTYTMPDTARYLHQRVGREKTVILTGAMIPLTGFTMSDGGFNLGFAISQLAHVEPGVYVAMNGTTFEATEVMKVISEGVFRSVKSNG